MQADPLLSLVMPVYNERETLPEILKRVGAVDYPVRWELVLVDDGSTDGGVAAADASLVTAAERVVVTASQVNRGKGAALRRGFEVAEGDILGVQDADLEYDPRQIPALVEPLLTGATDAVFGTREFGSLSSYSFWYTVGNRVLSVFASALFDRYITDAYTCYKFLTRDLYEKLRLTATGFDIEAELTGEILRNHGRVYEVPITYVARPREEGKKIHATDGLHGLLRLLEVRLRR